LDGREADRDRDGVAGSRITPRGSGMTGHDLGRTTLSVSGFAFFQFHFAKWESGAREARELFYFLLQWRDTRPA
jgi:hypothetical protein